MILEVDLAVTPQQLAQAYRNHRTRHLARSRARSMTRKHIRLAPFTANKGTQSWSTLLRAWSERWPDRAYTLVSVKNFARARAAREALLNTPELKELKEETMSKRRGSGEGSIYQGNTLRQAVA
jgi:hypothetical protein